MEEKVKEIMGIVFEVESADITADASSDQIENWDSLRHMNLIVAIEEEFELELDDDDIIEMMSLPLIITILEEKLS